MIDGVTDELEMPSFRLDGKLALVTGAGRGLGAAIATGFAQAGAEVYPVISRRIVGKDPCGRLAFPCR